MTEEIPRLCEKCGERPAVCFICFGATGESLHVCEKCDETTGLNVLQVRLDDQIGKGSCRYCGAPAVTGSLNCSLSFAEESELWCASCFEDLIEFSKQQRVQEDWDFDDDEQVKRFLERGEELRRAREEFMKERVARRKGSD
jgi:hypothetical protein